MGGVTDFLFGSESEQVGTVQSPGQTWLENLLKPMIQQAVGAGMGGTQLYPTASLPTTPTAMGYSLPNPYGIPQAQYQSPADFAGGYTDVINKMMEPYGDALGGAMTGWSGTGKEVLGAAMGRIAPTIMRDFTQYQLPYQQMAMLGAQDVYGAGIGQNQFFANAQNQMAAMGYGGGLQQMGAQQQAYSTPWNLMGMYSGSTGSPMVQPGQQGLAQTMAPFAAMGGMSALGLPMPF